MFTDTLWRDAALRQHRIRRPARGADYSPGRAPTRRERAASTDVGRRGSATCYSHWARTPVLQVTAHGVGCGRRPHLATDGSNR